jgi:chromosome segregation ATPase
LKLPKGTIKRTINGGPEALKDVYTELQGEAFSGYLQINLNKDGADSKGQIVLQEGAPVLSDYEHQTDTYSGSSAIKHVIGDSIKEDCNIEVHSDIEDIGLMITLFSKAKINPEDFDIDRQLEEIIEEEQKAKEEAERKAKEDTRKTEIKEQIDAWKGEGYTLIEIDDFDTKPLDEIEPVFSEYQNAIGKLRDLTSRLDGLDTKGFENETESIRTKLKDPILISDAEKELTDVESAIQDRDVRINELKKQIEKWREEGYLVDKLEQSIEEDFAKAWDEFTTFMDNVSSLKELTNKLNELKTKGFKDQVNVIKEKLRDPDKISEIESDISTLGKDIEDEKAKKEQLKNMLEDWKGQGYMVENLETVWNEKMFKDAEPAFIDFEKNLISLKKLADKLKSFEMEELAEQIDQISGALNDPDRLEDYTAEVAEIETKAGKINARKAELSVKMEEYKGNGYNVAKLEEVISGRLDTIESAFKKFENKLGQLQELSEKLGGMKTEGFEADVEAIQSKLKDIQAIEEINGLMTGLEEKIAEVENKRTEIRNKINEWKEEGFIVDKIESMIEGNIDSLWDAFAGLTDDIQALKDFKSKLGGLDTRNYKGEADAIAAKLTNPDLKAEVEQELGVLTDKIKADKKRRAELQETIDAWTNEGYVITRLEPFLTGNLTDLENTFGKLEQDINKLKGLEEKFNAFDVKGFKEEAGAIRSKIKDPDAVEELEGSIKELADKIEQAKILREVLKTKLDAWKNEEFIVTELEDVINGNLDTAQKVANDLETKVEALKSFAGKLAGLDTTWFKDDAGAIEGKLKDPALIGEIETGMNELDEKIQQDQSRRAKFKAKLNEWDGMGLKIGPLAEAMKEHISTIETKFKEFETDLNKLLALQEKIGIPGGAPKGKGKPKKDEPVEDWSDGDEKKKEAPDQKAAKKKKKGAEKTEKSADGKDLAKCGSCGELVPSDLPKCPKCGVSFGGEIFECPICKAMVSADEPKCSNCGAEFELE